MASELSRLKSFANVWIECDHASCFAGPAGVYLYRAGEVHLIAHYTRRRDALRALRQAGYTQEGRYWRVVPQRETEAVYG